MKAAKNKDKNIVSEPKDKTSMRNTTENPARTDETL